MSSKFKVQSLKLVDDLQWSAVCRAVLFAVLLILTAAYRPLTTVSAHEGEDHSKDAKTTAATPAANAEAVSIVTAERNITGESGEFNLVLKRSPGDPRTGETEQFLLKISEKIEGGFGGGEPLPLENATVSASVLEASGGVVKENLPVEREAGGIYRTSYAFGGAGNYKIVFSVRTEDGRSFTADFPVTVSRGAYRSSFLIGLLVLLLLTFGTIGAAFYAERRRVAANGKEKISYRRVAPFAAAAVLLFAVGFFALVYFLPARETRVAAAITPEAFNAAATNTLATSEVLTVPKESQILFGIKTAPVETRNIVAGLKVNGTVKAKPDARAVVTPPVSGRIVLNAGLTIGSAVGRGERIGYVEQVLDVSGQTELESQRLEVEAQQREIEARRLEIKNTVLQLQAQQAEQRANAQKARTQLAQAERELRRAANLVEVNAVPRKRLEEAQTAVKVAEQDVASAERQVALLDNQIKQTNAGQNVFRNPRVRQPDKTFPLTAPVTGLITDIKATSGQQVETGTEIASIVNLNTVLIEANVFERDLPAVRESTKASFTTAALSGEVYTIGTPDGDGRMVSVGQTVDPQTRTVPVIYEVINPLNRLRDGMFVEITIDTTENREVLSVPKQSVITEQGQTFVFVFDGGETFEKRAVALGAEGADYYEVKSGLKAGERVVTEGIYQLRSTQPGA
jgi:membrane fusion protein, heavy metal efflux system